MCAYDHGKNPNSVQNQGSLGRKGQQTSSQGKRETVLDAKGARFGFSLRGRTCPCQPYQRMDRAHCARCDQARNPAPAPVKPCPGEQRSEQGFSGSPVDGITSRQEYKGYKKILQENVLYGLIANMHVTLIELFRQGVALELGRMFQQVENT